MSDVLDALPRDVLAMIQPHLDRARDRGGVDPTLAAIGAEIAGKRDEAKAFRQSSNIEASWADAEYAYLGVDDANRHEADLNGRYTKPQSLEGPLISERRNKNADHRSTAYLRLTSRYVDAGAAKLGEILLPADDRNFSFKGMPVPRLLKARKDTSQVVHGDLGVPLTRPAQPGEPQPPQPQPPQPPQQLAPPAAPAGQPPQPAPGGAQPDPAAALAAMGQAAAQPPAQGGAGAAPALPISPAQPTPPGQVPLTVRDFALEAIRLADEQAEAAETRIYDWLVQSKYRGEIRKVIFDAARIGVGVLKGPTPIPRRAMALTKDAKTNTIRVQIRDTISPGVQWVDPWDIYPDPACGENIHDGSYIFERDHMSARQLRRLKQLPGYIALQIDQVLEEGPNKAYVSGADRGPAERRHKDRFEVWYFQGTLTKDEMSAIDNAAGRDPDPALDPDAPGRDEVSVIVTLVNDTVIRATINPLDSGEFPYHSMPWQRRAGSWAGVGVGEQMRMPQRMLNAALRALLNNAGKSAGSQMVIDQQAIVPADGLWTITPDKIWFKTQDGPQDARQSMFAIPIPNQTEQMIQIITLAERFAEETTSIPLITQGQSGATTPDTFGAAQLQNNNANQLLRSIGYSFDDYITEPLIRQFYEWLLLDPYVPDEEKGQFEIDAHGSVALVERAIQDQSIAQMGNMAANPIYGIDPKKWASLFLKSKRLDPQDIQYTEEEQEKMAAMPPPDAPAVAAARINADTQLKLGIMKQQADAQSAQSEQRIADAANVLEGQKMQLDSTIDLHRLEQQRQSTEAQLETQRQQSLDQSKTSLAKTAMQLQVERELNDLNNQIASRDKHVDAVVDVHKHAVDASEAARQHQADTAEAARQHAVSTAETARQHAATTAQTASTANANRAADLFKHRNPMPKPAVQTPGRAGNGRAASQSPS